MDSVHSSGSRTAASTKIVIAGGFGVGKTTLVGSVSEIVPLRTEALVTNESLAGRYVAPEVIEFPTNGGKLRIGYHPPFMDNHVGSREFARLPYQDIRGDEDAVKDLSRHAALHLARPEDQRLLHPVGLAGLGRADRAAPAEPGLPLRPTSGRDVSAIPAGTS